MGKMTLIYNRLVDVACAGKTVGWDTAAGWLGLEIGSPSGRQELSRILADVSFAENAAGRPLLSAVVVQPEIGYPGRDFFLLARELGLNHCGDDRSYYFYELKRVHAYWQRHAPVPAVLAPYRPAVERPPVLVGG